MFSCFFESCQREPIIYTTVRECRTHNGSRAVGVEFVPLHAVLNLNHDDCGITRSPRIICVMYVPISSFCTLYVVIQFIGCLLISPKKYGRTKYMNHDTTTSCSYERDRVLASFGTVLLQPFHTVITVLVLFLLLVCQCLRVCAEMCSVHKQSCRDYIVLVIICGRISMTNMNTTSLLL